MAKKPKDDSVGPWAKEKLGALGQYLNFYTTALKNQSRWLRGTVYIDAFAGSGFYRVRTRDVSPAVPDILAAESETDSAVVEYLKGSPRVALDIANPFSSYLFIEHDAERIADLRALRDAYQSSRNVEIHEGDANEALNTWLARGIDWRHHRALVFLDPFGMQVPWSTIDALAKTGAIEIIVNFPLGMAIQRLLTRSGEIPEGWQVSLDSFFGSGEWRSIVYQTDTGLFGEYTVKVSDAGARLLEWYRSRLRQTFGNVSTARLIRNTRGGPLYYLIWAGPHRLGLVGAEHVLGKGERS